MSANYHKILAGCLTSLAASAPLLPFPWSVVVGALAGGAAAGLVRPGRISRRLDHVSRAIPGTSASDRRIDEHGIELAKLMDRSHLHVGEQSER